MFSIKNCSAESIWRARITKLALAVALIQQCPKGEKLEEFVRTRCVAYKRRILKLKNDFIKTKKHLSILKQKVIETEIKKKIYETKGRKRRSEYKMHEMVACEEKMPKTTENESMLLSAHTFNFNTFIYMLLNLKEKLGEEENEKCPRGVRVVCDSDQESKAMLYIIKHLFQTGHVNENKKNGSFSILSQEVLNSVSHFMHVYTTRLTNDLNLQRKCYLESFVECLMFNLTNFLWQVVQLPKQASKYIPGSKLHHSLEGVKEKMVSFVGSNFLVHNCLVLCLVKCLHQITQHLRKIIFDDSMLHLNADILNNSAFLFSMLALLLSNRIKKPQNMEALCDEIVEECVSLLNDCLLHLSSTFPLFVYQIFNTIDLLRESSL